MATISVDIINPFLAKTKEILSQVCFVDVNVGKPLIREAGFDNNDWVIMVGVTGNVKGHVLLKLTESQACAIASKMCMMEISQVDDFASSAISELGNMIMGNVATQLSGAGTLIDITPPTLTHGNVNISFRSAKILCIPMSFDGGGLDLYLALSA